MPTAQRIVTCAIILLAGIVTHALAQMSISIGDPTGPLAGEIYNPGVGVKCVDRKTGDVLYPINVNNWWGHMNQQGDIINWPQFDWADYEYDGMIRVVHRGLTGYLNTAGNWSIAPQYEWADRFSNNVAIVRVDGKYGLIDKAARELVPTRLDGALRFNEGYAAVQVGDRCGFVDRRGSVAVQPQFQRVRSFHDGFAMVQLPAPQGQLRVNGLLGYIDKRGRFAHLDERRRFTDLGDFSDGLARARVGQQWGFIDKAFRVRIDAVYDDVSDFSDGLAAVRQGAMIGYIDKAGRLVVPLRYRAGQKFSDGLGLVERDRLWGFVNRVGEERVTPSYPWAEPFFRRYARVSMPPSFGYIGTNNNVIWDPTRPLDAIWDRTSTGLARIAVDILDPPKVNGFVQRQTSLKLSPPPPRDPFQSPYLADHLYLDELPKAGQ
jgi:hypothetical protein